MLIIVTPKNHSRKNWAKLLLRTAAVQPADKTTIGSSSIATLDSILVEKTCRENLLFLAHLMDYTALQEKISPCLKKVSHCSPFPSR